MKLIKSHMVRIGEKQYQDLKVLARKESRFFTSLLNRAIDNFLKAKKVVAHGKSKK